MRHTQFIILLVIIAIIISCKPQPKTNTLPQNTIPPDTLEYTETTEPEPEPETEKSALKHYFKNNTTLGAFFADSTSFRAAKDGFNSHLYDIEPLQITPSEQEYEEWDTFLSFGRVDIWDFFDDAGRILPGWEMIHHYRVYSPLQITSYQTDISEIPSYKIKNITSTCLIFLPYTSKNPQKASSLEIVIESVDDDIPLRDTYNTIPEPDDFQKLQAQATEKYRALGIESLYLSDDDRYLSFNLYDGFKVIIDITSDQNGSPYTALLYRSGFIPILFHLGRGEEDMELVQKYIDSTGDGQKPFPSWKSMEN